MIASVAEHLDRFFGEILPVKRIYPEIFPVLGSFFDQGLPASSKKDRIEVNILKDSRLNRRFWNGM